MVLKLKSCGPSGTVSLMISIVPGCSVLVKVQVTVSPASRSMLAVLPQAEAAEANSTAEVEEPASPLFRLRLR